MKDTTYKILLFMKRRPDLSVEAFRSYYESQHAPLCARFSTGVSRYVRRYIDQQSHPETGPADGSLPDVITELWFDNEATFNGTLTYITTSVMPDNIIEDERNLFNRSSFRIATVVERETPAAKLGAQ